MNIVIDCGWGGPKYDWGPQCLDKGIGGSEECVIYLARDLAWLGHDVTVINKCGENFREGGVRYMMPNSVNPHSYCDLYVAWRDWQNLVYTKILAKQKWLWCHDIPVGGHFPEDSGDQRALFAECDKVVLLNKHHRNLYSAVPDDKAFVCPIGVVNSHFDQVVDRIPGRVVACYHPNRGLRRLYDVWPSVRERVPHATLQAMWWEPEFFFHYNEEIGILPMFSAGHKELALEILKAEVFAYPSVFSPEISPASCIKAQCGGAIPVFVPQGGMLDVINFGVMANHGNFEDCLVDTLLKTEWQEHIRPHMMERSKEDYDWRHVAELWEQEFRRGMNPSGSH